MCICSIKVQGYEIFLNSSIWLYWQAHFPSLHQPVKGQQICELQTLILAYRKRTTWAYQRGCGEKYCTEKELKWHGSLSFKWEMWEHPGHAWAGIKAIDSHVFLPQHKEANFCPISCTNKNLSLTHGSSRCPRWQPEVGLFFPLPRTSKPRLPCHWLSSRISLKACAPFSPTALSASVMPAVILSFLSCISIPAVWVDLVFTMHKEAFM